MVLLCTLRPDAIDLEYLFCKNGHQVTPKHMETEDKNLFYFGITFIVFAVLVFYFLLFFVVLKETTSSLVVLTFPLPFLITGLVLLKVSRPEKLTGPRRLFVAVGFLIIASGLYQLLGRNFASDGLNSKEIVISSLLILLGIRCLFIG